MKILQAQNISKQYRLGTVGSGTLRDDVLRWWHTMRGKEDPFQKIGETNDRTQKGVSDYVWALQDVSFDVEQGEVLGIIGRNGAGKSTLLKILSKVTAPTTGNIKVKGRIASLLEVGTGFHPELTGKENIYLNGAILGMRKHEITRKLDEIIDFAGVERYIDTPVKRYSSGMYVRLAFAVAAHLESEILIVDEVLAVGDGEFQKMCLGKMKDVSASEGRTVLFVSHNLLSIKALCSSVMFLKNGNIKTIDETSRAIRAYMDDTEPRKINVILGDEGRLSEGLWVHRVHISSDGNQLNPSDAIRFNVEFEHSILNGFYINLIVRGNNEEVIFENPSPMITEAPGRINCTFLLPGGTLNSGIYAVQLNFHLESTELLGYLKDILNFELCDESFMDFYYGKRSGYIIPQVDFNYSRE